MLREHYLGIEIDDVIRNYPRLIGRLSSYTHISRKTFDIPPDEAVKLGRRAVVRPWPNRLVSRRRLVARGIVLTLVAKPMIFRPQRWHWRYQQSPTINRISGRQVWSLCEGTHVIAGHADLNSSVCESGWNVLNREEVPSVV